MGCPSLLHWSSLHHSLRIIHCLAPLLLSSAAMVFPSSQRCWMGAALPWWQRFSGVQRRRFWTSAVTSPKGSITGIGSLGFLLHPHCVHGTSRSKFVYMDGAIPSVQIERRSIYSLYCLFHFVKCPWVPWKALYKLNVWWWWWWWWWLLL